MSDTPHEQHDRELAETGQELIELARRTIDAVTDAPDGGDGMHTMGAAVPAADGTMHVGVNFYHFTGGPCAELVALAAARAAGAVDPQVVVAVGNQGARNQEPVRAVPPGDGRQLSAAARHRPERGRGAQHRHWRAVATILRLGGRTGLSA